MSVMLNSLLYFRHKSQKGIVTCIGIYFQEMEIVTCSASKGMAFLCGQNIHIIKYEMENTNNLPKGINESNCINTKSRILKSLSKEQNKIRSRKF